MADGRTPGSVRRLSLGAPGRLAWGFRRPLFAAAEGPWTVFGFPEEKPVTVRIPKDLLVEEEILMRTSEPAYFSKYPNVRFERSADGILVMSLHSGGGPMTFTAQDHESLVDAFYDVSRDRGNKVAILTGAGDDFMPGIDFASFGDVSDPD